MKRSVSAVMAVAAVAFFVGQHVALMRAAPAPNGVVAQKKQSAKAVSVVEEVFVARVTKIIDGDTVAVEDGRKIRLLGIDTPEKGFKDAKGVYHDDPAPYAEQATQRLKGIAEGQQCSFSFDKEKFDRYGRTLSYMVCRGLEVNRTMIAEGFASVMIYPPNDSRKDELLSAQREAQAAGRGIWAGGIVPADTAAKHMNELRVIRGRVERVGLQKSMIYLNFGKDYKTDFTVGIRRRDWPLFASVGMVDARAFEGKEISVTGRIRERNGPYVDVTIPEQIAVERDGSSR
jgi:endonuclease YncB( thermonuclease family)